MGSPTANKGLTVPTLNGDFGTWGNEINGDLGILDLNLGGVLAVAVGSGGTVVASASDAQNVLHQISGTTSATYLLPEVGSFYIIDNGASSAVAVGVGTISAIGGTVSVAQNTSMLVATDGTNAASATSAYLLPNLGSLTVTGLLTAGTITTAGSITGASGSISGNMTITGAATVSGSRVVIADGGLYAINITGTAAAAPWSGLTGIPANVSSIDQNVSTGGAPTFLAVGTAAGVWNSGGLANAGSTAGSASGWQLDPSGTGAFSAGVNVGINNSGLDMLSNRYIAASDARVKPVRNRISGADGIRFVYEVPGYLYQKEDRRGVRNWEAGFLAQDAMNAGFQEMVLSTIDLGMPRMQYGAEGPPGVRYEMVVGGQVAYLAAALREALDRIAALEARE